MNNTSSLNVMLHHSVSTPITTLSQPSVLSLIVEHLTDMKAHNICPLDIKEFNSLADFMVVATGNSSRHVKAIADTLYKNLKAQDVYIHGVERDSDNEWILLNLGDIVVHIMQKTSRDFYQLEKLWDSSSSNNPSWA